MKRDRRHRCYPQTGSRLRLVGSAAALLGAVLHGRPGAAQPEVRPGGELPAPAPPAAVPAPAPAASGPFSAVVRGRPQPRAISEFHLDRPILSAAPAQHAAELLSRAPGVYIARPEGDAVAHQIYLRGFDAEHGQDIELSAGPVPINLPSHIHGQGYADLGFLIPEVVRSLNVTEGVYDPRQGDFAVAGSIHFDLGVAERGLQLRSEYGSFHTFRQLLLWAPRGQPEDTFAAVSIRRSDGFGQNRGSLSGAMMGQYAFGKGGLRGMVHAAAYGARAGLAGVLRREDVESGRVGFYDSYPDPVANAQSALALRAQLGATLEHRQDSGAESRAALWLLYSGFRQRVNFTGYLERSIQRPRWVGRGDLIEQENWDLSLGARTSYRTRRLQPASWLSATFEVGAGFRLDLIDQAQGLLQAPQNETWDRRVDAQVRASDISLHGDGDLRITRHLRLRGGIRADVLYYDIDDRLGNFTPAFQRQTHLPGFRRTALGVAWGPRASVEVLPHPLLSLNAAYGEGYRSPQARQLEEGENAPFTKVRSVDVGLRLRLLGERLTLSAAGYATLLSSDLAFDPGEGRLERVGPTTRLGALGHVQARPLPWLLGVLSVTYVHATLDAPPPATAENPAPAYRPGQLLPYVPPVVLRLDLGADRELWRLRGRPLGGHAGVGFTCLSPRPLPFGSFADPVALLDASLSVRYWFLELGVQAFNLANAQYAAVEYSFVSDWGTRAIPSLLPARHLSAGAPLTLLGTLAVHL